MTNPPASTPPPSSGRRALAGGTNFLNDFKKFILRGNVLDLAIAVVIGAAFNAVVNALVQDVILPFIAAIFGKPNFDDITFKVADGVVKIGSFITALINFLIIAFACFMIIKTFEALQNRRRRGQTEPDDEPELPADVVLLAEIRDLLAAEQQPRA